MPMVAFFVILFMLLLPLALYARGTYLNIRFGSSEVCSAELRAGFLGVDGLATLCRQGCFFGKELCQAAHRLHR